MGARRGPTWRTRTSASHPGEKDGVRPLDRVATRLQNTVYSISYAKPLRVEWITVPVVVEGVAHVVTRSQDS